MQMWFVSTASIICLITTTSASSLVMLNSVRLIITIVYDSVSISPVTTNLCVWEHNMWSFLFVNSCFQISEIIWCLFLTTPSIILSGGNDTPLLSFYNLDTLDCLPYLAILLVLNTMYQSNTNLKEKHFLSFCLISDLKLSTKLCIFPSINQWKLTVQQINLLHNM